jgi:hypothetical protein
LKKEHEKLGINYVSLQPDGTFNDSEALIYDLARFVEGQTDKVKATGSVAFIMVKRHNGKPISVLFGRNSGSPLKIWKDKKGITLSSEGKGTDVPVNVLHEFNYATKKITTKPMEISSGWGNYGATCTTCGGYGLYSSGYDYGTTFSDNRERLYLRSGTETKIAHDFLIEGGHNAYHSAILAERERQEIEMEARSIKYLIDCEAEGYDLDDLLDYWCELEDYERLLAKVADRLYGQKELGLAYDL